MQTMIPFSGLFGCCAPLVWALSLAVAATLLFSPAAAQARFAGLVVCHDDRDIFLVGLDSTFGGYYYAGLVGLPSARLGAYEDIPCWQDEATTSP